MSGEAGLGILDTIYSQHAPKCTRNDGYFDSNSRIWTACEKALHIVTDNISAMANINHMGGHPLTPHLLAINLYAAGRKTSQVFRLQKR